MKTPEQIAAHMMMGRRVMVCAGLIVLFMLGLCRRLWQVQVQQGTEHARDVSMQITRSIRVSPVRGRIFSGDGHLLVGNRCVYDVTFQPAKMRKGKLKDTEKYIYDNVRRLDEAIGRVSDISKTSLHRHLVQSPALPLTVYKALDEVGLNRLWEVTPWIDGMEIQTRMVRDYTFPGMLSQTLGFTANVRQEKDFAGTDLARGYGSLDQIGREGLEKFYDRELAGRAGAHLLQVDPAGYARVKVNDTLVAVDGNDLVLSIDSRAQRIGEELLAAYRGALVLVDANTGAVLALVSTPGFNLAELTAASYGSMAADRESQPMLNRPVNRSYMPGSIVKPLVGLAALEHGSINAEWRHDCIGHYSIGKSKIHCAKRTGHGEMDIYDAITVSCNPFFMSIGIKTGIDVLSPMFSAAGLGEKTGIDFQERATGICPAREVARKYRKRNWLMADTALCSMGQGLIEVTPLQMAMYCAALANGGRLMRPYLVAEIRDGAGNLVRMTSPQVRNTLPVSEDNLKIIRQAMANAVEAREGSGHILSKMTVTDGETGEIQPVALAAKTGTAERGSKANRKKDTWMIVYGPLPKPEYAFACLVEDGESGSKTVAPIAFEFWNRWLNLK